MHYINSKKGSAPNPNAGAPSLRSCARARAWPRLNAPGHAGVGDKITLADLAPAKEVMRLIKRKQLASQQARTRAAAALPRSSDARHATAGPRKRGA